MTEREYNFALLLGLLHITNDADVMTVVTSCPELKDEFAKAGLTAAETRARLEQFLYSVCEVG